MKARRKIIVYIATSADGYIARPDGDVEWLNRRPRTVDYGMREFYPMVATSDVVYVADDSRWAARARQWARQRRVEVVQRLQSVPWNRNLEWRVGRGGIADPAPVPGSLECVGN